MNQQKILFRHRPVTFTLGLIALAVLTLTACGKEDVKAPPAPVAVNTIKVDPQPVPVKTSFVSQVESSHLGYGKIIFILGA